MKKIPWYKRQTIMRIQVPTKMATARRELTIERDESRKFPLVYIDIQWFENDPREKHNSLNKDRVQNVITDCRAVLFALQRLYPELEITFKENDDKSI